MIKSGQVPEDLQQLYEEGSKNSPPPRLFKSQLINKVFQQNTRGESVFAPGNTQCEVFKKNSRFASKNLKLLGCLTPSCRGKNPGKPASFEWAERRGDVYQKDGYYHVRTIATAIEKKQGSSMVLHGGQANLTKDEYSQMSQFMSGRPWSQFGTGASCGGNGSGSGSCGSGSHASSTPTVVTSSSALPKAICDAPVKLSRASAPRSDWAEIVKDWLSKSLTRKTKKSIILWWMFSPSFQRQNACLRLLHWSFDVVITYLQNIQSDLILHILNSNILICSNNKKFEQYSFCTSSNHVELTAHKIV